MIRALVFAACCLALQGCAIAQADALTVSPLVEQRYCGPPPRTEDGEIKRRSDVIAAFRRVHPCPPTGLTTGACPGWAIDHTIPMACGGCDAVSNMQWLPVEIKSAAGRLPKDRWERLIYCTPFKTVPQQ